MFENIDASVIKTMMNAMPFSICLWDDTFTLVDCNTQALKMFEIDTLEELSQRIFELSPELQPCGTPTEEKGLMYLKAAMESGHESFEYMLLTTGSEPFMTEIELVRIPHGDSFMIMDIATDMRALNAAKVREQQADSLRVKLLDACPMFIEIWDDQQNLIYCNSQVMDMLKLKSSDEFIERYEELSPKYQPCGTPSMQKAKEYLLETVADGYCRFEWHHLTAEGELLPVDATFVRILHDGRYITIGYSYDLSAIKAALAEAHEAEESSQAKTRFLARMSHEIRTPLNAIMGLSEIQTRKKGYPQEVETAFARIYDSSKLLLSIINDILDLSKVEADKMEITPVIYDVASMIVDTVQLNMMAKGETQIAFSLTVDEQLPTHLEGDELRIKQVLNNILSNAFKYTAEGSVSLSIEVEQKTDGEGKDDEIILVFQTKDTGQGMTAEELENLFEDFTRFNFVENRTIEGSGLGLPIAYKLVKIMGGDIDVQSTPGVGSVFTVRIPQNKKHEKVLGKETVESLQRLKFKPLRPLDDFEIIPMPHGRVLVVDDIDINLYVMEGILEPYQIKVDLVQSGKAAIDKISSGEKYDIVFMDHMMPCMDGIEATKILRKIGYSLPIVALTANAIIGQSDMFMQNGFDGFVSKPVDIKQLNNCLLRFIKD